MEPKIDLIVRSSNNQDKTREGIMDWSRLYGISLPVPPLAVSEAILKSRKLGLNKRLIESLEPDENVESRQVTGVWLEIIYGFEDLEDELQFMRGYYHEHHGKINHNALASMNLSEQQRIKIQEFAVHRKENYDTCESNFYLLDTSYNKEGIQELFREELLSTLEKLVPKQEARATDSEIVKFESEKLGVLKRAYEVELKRELSETMDKIALTRLGESLMLISIMKSINSKAYEAILDWYADSRKKLFTIYDNKLINPTFDDLETVLIRLCNEEGDEEEKAEIKKTCSMLQKMNQTAKDYQEALQKAYDDLPIHQQIIQLEDEYRQKQELENAEKAEASAAIYVKLQSEKEAIDDALGLRLTKKQFRGSEKMQKMKNQAHDILDEEWADAEDTSKVLTSLLDMTPEQFRDLLDKVDKFSNYNNSEGADKKIIQYDIYGLFEKMSSLNNHNKYHDMIRAVYGESAPEKITALNNMTGMINGENLEEVNNPVLENESAVDQDEIPQIAESVPITTMETEVFPVGVGPEKTGESTEYGTYGLVHMNVTDEELKSNEAVLAKIKSDLEYAGYDTKDFDSARILWLLEVNNAWGGRVRRSPDLYTRDNNGNITGKNPNGWLSGSPYFISTIADEGIEYHICESPMVGNRTYLFRSDVLPGDIEEVLTLPKGESAEFGIRFNHKENYSATDYRDKVLDRITHLNHHIKNQNKKREHERIQKEKIEFKRKIKLQNTAVEALRAAGISDKDITELLKLT